MLSWSIFGRSQRWPDRTIGVRLSDMDAARVLSDCDSGLGAISMLISGSEIVPLWSVTVIPELDLGPSWLEPRARIRENKYNMSGSAPDAAGTSIPW
jgi:hypothetical protein